MLHNVFILFSLIYLAVASEVEVRVHEHLGRVEHGALVEGDGEGGPQHGISKPHGYTSILHPFIWIIKIFHSYHDGHDIVLSEAGAYAGGGRGFTPPPPMAPFCVGGGVRLLLVREVTGYSCTRIPLLGVRKIDV